MAKSKGPTPTERATAAEKSAKAARTGSKNLREQIAELKSKSAARLRQVKGAVTSKGAQRIGTAAAGGFLAGAGTELIVQYAVQGAFGDGTAKEYLSDPRLAGSLVAGVGAVGLVLGEKSKGKHKALLVDVAAGVVAGGAACAARKVVRNMLPNAVMDVQGPRYYQPAFNRLPAPAPVYYPSPMALPAPAARAYPQQQRNFANRVMR